MLIDSNKHIRFTEIGSIIISTVVLPFPYGTDLYETMIFGGDYDQFQQRYEKLERAIEGHEEQVKKVANAKT